SELEFRFRPQGKAIELLRQFSLEVQQSRKAKISSPQLNPAEVVEKLESSGFNKRKLKSFQVRDVSTLVGLPHGANFSVPGAGKTTVTFALHFLIERPDLHLLVIAP